MRSVKLYEKKNGRSPVKEFLDLLPGKLFQKVSWTVELVENFQMVPSEYLKKLSGTDELLEIRVHLGSDAIRLLGFFEARI